MGDKARAGGIGAAENDVHSMLLSEYGCDLSASGRELSYVRRRPKLWVCS
jgi:hypothetical protein